MKKITSKTVALLSTILMLFLIFSVPVMAEGTVDTDNKVILKKSDTEYLIYYKDLCNEEFEFAFSTNNAANVDELNFTKSAQDQSESEKSNIAYLDDSLQADFETGNEAYIWVRNNNDEMVVEADKIDLSNALTEEQLELVNTTTERISVDTTKTNETTETVDGVEKTIIKGKAVIDEPKDGATYSYAIALANDESSNAGKLYKLATDINAATNTYEKLKLSNEFYNLYTAMLANLNWEEVDSNLTVLQPDGTENGDKYILWLKEDNAETIYDAQFLTSTNKEEEGTNKVEKEITEVVKNPVTFDSGSILLIILAVIVIALIIFIVVRKKENNKVENK